MALEDVEIVRYLKVPFVAIASVALVMMSGSFAMAKDRGKVECRIRTNLGTIALELNAEKAPETVANFLQYANEDFYDGTIFHRVIDGFMIQGGGYTSDYARKETHEPILNESDNGLRNKRGTIAMARTGDPHSATAQFFINVADNDFLNYNNRWGYAVFGRVVKGMKVVDSIRKVQTGRGGPFPKDVPQTQVTIEAVTCNS